MAIFVVYTLRSKTKVDLRLQLLFVLVFALFTIVLIFGFKTDSSSGRLLIYKISFNMLKDNWFLGIGLGKFKAEYMHYQARYFSSGKYSSHELLLADNTYFAFNEYFQFIIETGLLGILVIVSSFFTLQKVMSLAFLSGKKRPLILNAIGLTTAILIAAIFNYVFHILIFQVLLITCIIICTAVVFYNRDNLYFVGTVTVGAAILVLVIAAEYNFNLNEYSAKGLLKQIKLLEASGSKISAEKMMSVLDHTKIENSEYLEVKSAMLVARMDLVHGLEFTLRLIKLRPSSGGYARLGHIYELKGDNLKAERAYLTAIAMVPNRFLIRNKLYQFYKKTNQYKKATLTAHTILSLPIKVQSPVIFQLRHVLENEINSNKITPIR